jgi:signal transduction histidine kinase
MTEPRPRSRWGLTGKLISAMLIVGTVPLLVGLGTAFVRGTRELHQTAGANFASLAAESARTLDLIFSDELTRATRIAVDPLLVGALERRAEHYHVLDQAGIARELAALGARWHAKDQELVRSVTTGPLADDLQQYVARPDGGSDRILPAAARAATKALFLTDLKGVVVASTSTQIPYLNQQEVWWQGAYDKGVGRPHLGNVSFDDQFGVYTFHLSVPVMDRIRYQVIGVLHRVLDVKEYLAPSVYPIVFGKTGHVMVIDSLGTVMSCPILPTGIKLKDERLIALVTPQGKGWVKAPSDGHGGDSTSLIGFSSLPGTSRITQASTNTTWHTFVWQSSDELFAPTRQFFAWVAGFGLAAIGLLGALGYIAAVRIVKPIRRLQESAALIGRGELKEPIAIKTGDELEQLAEAMNRMNSQLERTFSGLTETVEEQMKTVRSLEQINQQILESVPTPILLLTPDHRIDYVNQSAREAFCLATRAIKGEPLFSLISLETGGKELLAAALKEESGMASIGLRAGVGAARDPLKPVEFPTLPAGCDEVSIGGRTFQFQLFTIAAPASDQRRVGLVFRDMTDEKHQRDQVIEAEKESGMSVLTSGIGHELNNPLFGIIGLGEAMLDEQDQGKLKEHARDVVKQARRMADVIEGLTGSAKLGAKGKMKVDVKLNDELNVLVAQLRSEEGNRSVEILTSYGTLPLISTRPDDLRQVLVQVMRNAVQAMKGIGRLEIATEAAKGVVSIRIKDSGPGIPSAYLNKVFDPFFTTKAQGEGRGLGLTIARRLVEGMGGRIWIDSQEGKGTTVEIALPVSDRAAVGNPS